MKRPLYMTNYKTYIFDKTGITYGARSIPAGTQRCIPTLNQR